MSTVSRPIEFVITLYIVATGIEQAPFDGAPIHAKNRIYMGW